MRTLAVSLGLVALACKPTPLGSAPMRAASSAPPLSSSGPDSCGPFVCEAYDTPALAFRAATRGDPRVVSVGEAHAPKGARATSAAKRFTEEILPSVASRASDLVVELMLPPTGCKARVAEVKKTQEVVTQHQAAEDQNEYVAMGEAARKLGVVPDLLRPTCADLGAIEDAGDDAIDASLMTIERLTEEAVKKLVLRARQSPSDRSKMVLTYGGAIHNDRDPSPERQAWSFGPALDRFSDGHYVEIDLYVPEFMDGSDMWKKLPWFPYYDRDRFGQKTMMFRLRERSFVLVLPLSVAPLEAGSPQ